MKSRPWDVPQHSTLRDGDPSYGMQAIAVIFPPPACPFLSYTRVSFWVPARRRFQSTSLLVPLKAYLGLPSHAD